MKTVKSSLEFVDYKITSFEYQSSLDSSEKIKYTISIETKMGKLKEKSEIEFKKNLARIDLNLKLKGKVGKRIPVKITCSISGIFAADKMISEEDFMKLCSTSGVANLLMILRSIIISFTSQTGNKPIIMPFINLLETYRRNIGLVDKNKKNREK